MYNFSEVVLEQIAVHFVGNKQQGEPLLLSKQLPEIRDDIISDLLLKYFLSPFKGEQFYNLFHEESLGRNIVYSYASAVFDDSGSFFAKSVKLAEHLYDRSVHHAIKGGEFYIVYIRDCVIDGEYVDALGLFKSENKETYLKVMHSKQEVSISYDKGVNINKLDKGCLILNTEKERGYKVCIVDNSSGNRDTAGYWKDEFLGLEARTDSFYRTRQYLDLCKEFVKDVYNNENDVNRIEQAGLLDRTVGYFRENEFFRENDFEQTVIREPEVIDAFRDYKQQYMEESNVQGMGEFDISEGAVKSAQKYFKSVLKLDRNFHVYIHGNHRMIERGYDEGMGKKYYKLYYDQER